MYPGAKNRDWNTVGKITAREIAHAFLDLQNSHYYFSEAFPVQWGIYISVHIYAYTITRSLNCTICITRWIVYVYYGARRNLYAVFDVNFLFGILIENKQTNILNTIIRTLQPPRLLSRVIYVWLYGLVARTVYVFVKINNQRRRMHGHTII